MIPEEENPQEPKESEPIWHVLWQYMVLHDSDFEILKKKRGFSEKTIHDLGFKSSGPHNRKIIEQLVAEFTEEEMLKQRVLYRYANGSVGPQPQLCGFGFGGALDDKGKPKMTDGANPILIPYFDESGKVYAIRPHKGGLKRTEDKLNPHYTGMDVYCPHLLRTVHTVLKETFNEELPGNKIPFLVICEGEYKADALWQCGIASLAFPGIQSLTNSAFKAKVFDILAKFQIKNVVVVFDNECKNDPLLPSWKPDPWDRYDSLVYAKYTAQALKREGIPICRVGKLPDEWRINGKADWDGALASFVEQKGIVNGTIYARKQFLKVIDEAVDDKGLLELFPGEAQRIVESKITRLFHRPQCLIGNDETQNLGFRLKEMPKYSYLGQAFLDCYHRYYTRTPIGDPKKIAAITDEMKQAADSKDWSTYRALQEKLNGIPKPISNFTLKCDFKLISADKKTEYLSRLANVHGEKNERHVRISSGTLARLSEFREFCLETDCTWKGGEKDLQNLTDDMQAHAAFRNIYEIDTYGWSSECGLWKFADRAFTADGELILPDSNMVFWHNGIGYQTDFGKQLGQGFQMGPPILGEYKAENAGEAFMLLSNHLFDVIGDYDGWLLLGQILSYAFHPEILVEYKGAPGAWLTGRRGGGKSTIAEWVTRIWGFKGSGLSLGANTTGNFVSRELSKYGCMPLWFDEFDASVTLPAAQDQLKDAFGRVTSGKAAYTNNKQTRGIQPETTPIVTGETGVRTPATRSRYLQIIILDERSKGTPSQRLREMNSNIHKFPSLGQFLMLHRKELAEKVMKYLQKWVDDNHTAEYITKPRERFISGTPFVTWIAVAELMMKHCPSVAADIDEKLREIPQFKEFALRHGSESQKDTFETNYVIQFWQDILNMLQSGLLEHKYFKFCYAEINADTKRATTREYDVPTTGCVPILYMAYDPVYLKYEIEIRKAGRPAKMSLGDLRRDFKREKYWILPKEGQNSHRPSMTSDRMTCWCINLEEHPLRDEFVDYLEYHRTQRQTGDDGQRHYL